MKKNTAIVSSPGGFGAGRKNTPDVSSSVGFGGETNALALFSLPLDPLSFSRRKAGLAG